MNYTKYMISGRLVREPEVIETKAGKLTKICVAVNRKVGGEDHASFFDIEGWEKVAEKLSTFKKGQVGFFEGDIIMKKYEAKKDGNVIRNEDGKPIMRTDISFRCYNSRYISKPETSKEESEDAPW